ncbi:hypothetical protein PV327_011267 [Microctonus hyperodae]|uniref:Uncharacterized protein n=1 Tax=Microctonus hyperodae TaxID=165561 RepID=A0AA39KRW2_MICHY|nr:hypothetical protein PV327_011267 [Microctonus hyperodae]
MPTQDFHTGFVSNCAIDEQCTQAEYDGTNENELVSNKDHEIVPNSSDASCSSVSCSIDDEIEITHEQVKVMAATLPRNISKNELMREILITAAMEYNSLKWNSRRGNSAKSILEIKNVPEMPSNYKKL